MLVAGGKPPYDFSVADGTFPRGLFTRSDGCFVGSAQAAATYTFTLTVRDQAGSTATKTFTLTVTRSNVNDTGATTAAPLGHNVRLAGRVRTAGCTRSANPDRRCSPGAYYSRLTKTVICSANFHTNIIPAVTATQRTAVEREYRMPIRAYGRTIELDHIISLALGGSSDIANLFPESGSGPANYHAKDRLETKLHQMVCSGRITLASARDGLATNWQQLYRHVFGQRAAV